MRLYWAYMGSVNTVAYRGQLLQGPSHRLSSFGFGDSCTRKICVKLPKCHVWLVGCV